MEALMLAKSFEVVAEHYLGRDLQDDVHEYAYENSETFREYDNFVKKAREELLIGSFNVNARNYCKCKPDSIYFCNCYYDKLMADNGIINLSQYFNCSLVNHLIFIGIILTDDPNTMTLVGEELGRVRRERKKVKSIFNKK